MRRIVSVIILLSVSAMLAASPFTLADTYQSQLSSSVFHSFIHEETGFRVIYEENSSGPMYADLIFRTPQQDMGDLNHVFEHSLLSGSGKYPSSYLIMDLLSRSYLYEGNAATYQGTTDYFLSSMSQDQMMIFIDILMSLVEDPDLIREEKIFRREAIRYDLFSPDGEIIPAGTIYSEDTASLSDRISASLEGTAQNLYPGMHVSNVIGRLPLHPEECTYERVLDIYDDYYRWDNCILYLYGNLDIGRILEFLDEEYLKGSTRTGTDLSRYFEEEPEPGFREAEAPIAMPSGTAADGNSSILSYTFDINDFSDEEMNIILHIAGNITDSSGMLAEELHERGVEGTAAAINHGPDIRRQITFFVDYADPDDKEAFSAAVMSVIRKIAEGGLSDEAAAAIADAAAGGFRYREEDGTLPGENSLILKTSFVHSDGFGAFRAAEEAIIRLKEDGSAAASEVFSKLLEPERPSLLLVTSPEPGLLDGYYDRIDGYLKEMKESMTDEEIRDLIRETEEYYEWAAISYSNDSVGIDPSLIPDFRMPPEPHVTKEDGIRTEMLPVQSELLYISLSFPSDMIPSGSKEDLALFTLLLGNVPAAGYSAEELSMAMDRLLIDFSFTLRAEGSRPMLMAEFYADKENAEEAIRLLTDILSASDFSDMERIRSFIGTIAESYNPAMIAMDMNAFYYAAPQLGTPSMEYRTDVFWNGFYDYLQGILGGNDPAFAERLRKINDSLLQRNGLTVTAAGNPDVIERCCSMIAGMASELPYNDKEAVYAIPEIPHSIAILSNLPSSILIRRSSMEGLRGEYIPWLMAAASEELIDLRVSGGAYSADTAFGPISGSMVIYAYADLTPSVSYGRMETMWDSMKDKDISAEDLKAFTLASLAISYPGKGPLFTAVNTNKAENGISREEKAALINGQKKASLETKDEALGSLEERFSSGYLLAMGPEEQLGPILDDMELIIDLR